MDAPIPRLRVRLYSAWIALVNVTPASCLEGRTIATIYDVARRAQVSPSTVSRVINDNPSVAAPIRKAVLAAADELGYRPNEHARQLRTARTQLLGMVLPSLGSTTAGLAVHAAACVARQHGYMILVNESDRDEAHQVAHLNALLSQRVDGLLLQPVRSAEALLEPARAAGTPAVLLATGMADPSAPSVVVDRRAAFTEAFGQLRRLRHERIALLSNGGSVSGRVNSEIWRELYAEAGLAAPPELHATVTTALDAAQSLRQMLVLERPPSALFLRESDVPAALIELRVAGLAVPDDFSIVAFGDGAWLAASNPAIDAVAVDVEARSRAATELLVRCIRGDESAPQVITFNSKYIPRASMGPVSR